MKIIKTGMGPGVLTDDEEVLLPNNYDQMVQAALHNPDAVSMLLTALLEEVARIIPLTGNLKVPQRVDQSWMDEINAGLMAAEGIRGIAGAINGAAAVADSEV